MKWQKISQARPRKDENVLYYDGEKTFCVQVKGNGKLISCGYVCNDPECSWTYDDCGCEIIEKPDDMWANIGFNND